MENSEVRDNIHLFSAGDQAVTLSLGQTINERTHKKVMAIRVWLEQHSFQGLLDIVIAYSSVTLIYDAFVVKQHYQPENVHSFVKQKLAEASAQSEMVSKGKSKQVQIPVCYEESYGPDLKYISKLKKISIERIIELHIQRTYRVYMIGFLPGFPYMAEVDEALAVPRKETPEKKVEAGSVGIAGIQTGIYPVASPGGWQIIGRTPLSLFSKNEPLPVHLEPGDEVKFYAISANEFNYSDGSWGQRTIA